MPRLSPRIASAAIILLILACLLVQLVLPALADELGGQFAETRALVVPYAAAGILSLALIEASFVIVLVILGRAKQERAFTRSTTTLMTCIQVLIAAACAVPVLVMLHLLLLVGVGGPGIVLLVPIIAIIGLAAVALVAAAKQQLQVAIRNQAELDAVI